MKGNWRDGSWARSVYFSCRGLEFCSRTYVRPLTSACYCSSAGSSASGICGHLHTQVHLLFIVIIFFSSCYLSLRSWGWLQIYLANRTFFFFWYWAFNQRLSRARQTSCHGVACPVPSYSPQNVHSRTVQLSTIVSTASSSSPHQQACSSLSHPSTFLYPRVAAPHLPLLP